MQDVTKVLTAHYKKCLERYGATPRAMEWRKPEDLWLRFEIMLRVIRDKRKQFTLLDVGCGIGLLLDYLFEHDYPIKEYVGIDATSNIVEAAKDLHPSQKFVCADICDSAVELPEFDYVVTNGMFNLRYTATVEKMDRFFHCATQRMYSLCNIGMAFNVMSSHVNYRSDKVYYKDPGEVIAYCVKNLSRFVKVYHDYPLYEYFTCVYRTVPMRQ